VQVISNDVGILLRFFSGVDGGTKSDVISEIYFRPKNNIIVNEVIGIKILNPK